MSASWVRARPNCYICDMSRQDNTEVHEDYTEEYNKGAALFDNYVAAKKSLTDRMKQVLSILAQCQVIEVHPSSAKRLVLENAAKVACNHWRYNKGHRTIYCNHYYPQSHHLTSCTVTIPVTYLGMSDDELYSLNRDIAIESLESQKEALTRQIAELSKPINKKMEQIDQQIDALRNNRLPDGANAPGENKGALIEIIEE